MKNPCPLCQTRKAQRLCFRHNNAVICSVCCAAMRNETCAGCTHQAAAQQYQAERQQHLGSKKLPGADFIIEMSPEVEDASDVIMNLCQQRNTKAAWPLAKKLIEEHPNNYLACHTIAVLHGLDGNLKECIRWYDKTLAIFPYFIDAHFNRAVAYKNELNVGECLKGFRDVVAYGDPQDETVQKAQSFLDNMSKTMPALPGGIDTFIESQALFEQAYLLMAQGDWTGALAGFRASAAKNPYNAPTLGNIGLCQAQLGHKAQALKALDLALQTDPDYEPARSNRLVVESMKEGAPLKNTIFKSIDFGREKALKNKAG